MIIVLYGGLKINHKRHPALWKSLRNPLSHSIAKVKKASIRSIMRCFTTASFWLPFIAPPKGEVLPAQMSYTKLFIKNEFSVALISYPVY
ncbi:hypothetical protein [Sphingobacterium sp.]|uniref:hypothetical protein n=1 Tax=Sphingobacterium sp. TaxID=341027 RepID=UPI0031DA7623